MGLLEARPASWARSSLTQSGCLPHTLQASSSSFPTSLSTRGHHHTWWDQRTEAHRAQDTCLAGAAKGRRRLWPPGLAAGREDEAPAAGPCPRPPPLCGSLWLAPLWSSAASTSCFHVVRRSHLQGNRVAVHLSRHPPAKPRPARSPRGGGSSARAVSVHPHPLGAALRPHAEVLELTPLGPGPLPGTQLPLLERQNQPLSHLARGLRRLTLAKATGWRRGFLGCRRRRSAREGSWAPPHTLSRFWKYNQISSHGSRLNAMETSLWLVCRRHGEGPGGSRGPWLSPSQSPRGAVIHILDFTGTSASRWSDTPHLENRQEETPHPPSPRAHPAVQCAGPLGEALAPVVAAATS